MKILVVEDDPNCQRLMQLFLKPFSACDIARDGREGIERWTEARLRGEPYEVVCVDIDMPRCNGYEVIKEIRDCEIRDAALQTEPCDYNVMLSCHIFVTSSRSDESDIGYTHRMGGCDAYLVKPVMLDTLRRELARHGFVPYGQVSAMSLPPIAY